MRKLLVIGDSSPLARQELEYDYLYTTLLKNRLINTRIEISAVTGNTARQIALKLDAYTLYGFRPDTVVLNYGIVDAYPRPYPHSVYKFLKCTGLITLVDKLLKKTKLYYKTADLFRFKEVELDSFKYYTDQIVEKLLKDGVKKIIFVTIIKPDKILLRSKFVEQEVALYNNVFFELFQKYKEVYYIDIYSSSTKEYTIWDGYHYSNEVSKHIANEIEKILT